MLSNYRQQWISSRKSFHPPKYVKGSWNHIWWYALLYTIIRKPHTNALCFTKTTFRVQMSKGNQQIVLVELLTTLKYKLLKVIMANFLFGYLLIVKAILKLHVALLTCRIWKVMVIWNKVAIIGVIWFREYRTVIYINVTFNSPLSQQFFP